MIILYLSSSSSSPLLILLLSSLSSSLFCYYHYYYIIPHYLKYHITLKGHNYFYREKPLLCIFNLSFECDFKQHVFLIRFLAQDTQTYEVNKVFSAIKMRNIAKLSFKNFKSNICAHVSV